MSHTGLSLEFGSAAAREVAGRRDVAGRRRVARDHVPRLREPGEAVGGKALRLDPRDEDGRRRLLRRRGRRRCRPLGRAAASFVHAMAEYEQTLQATHPLRTGSMRGV